MQSEHFLFWFSAYIDPKLHGTTKQMSLSLNSRAVSGFGSACFLVSWGSFPAIALEQLSMAEDYMVPAGKNNMSEVWLKQELINFGV